MAGFILFSCGVIESQRGELSRSVQFQTLNLVWCVLSGTVLERNSQLLSLNVLAIVHCLNVELWMIRTCGNTTH